MSDAPNRGDSVRVWPLNPRVAANSNGGGFLSPMGKPVEWSAWWELRLRDGDITITDPNHQPETAPDVAPQKGDE